MDLQFCPHMTHFIFLEMSRREQLAELLNLAAYQRALEAQIHFLQINYHQVVGHEEARQIVMNEIRRVAVENREAKNDLRLLSAILGVNIPGQPRN